MNRDGLNMIQVKKKNKTSILNCINAHGEVSRIDIANETGLTAASLTQITAPMLEDGILLEVGADRQSVGAGRKKILLKINYNYKYLFAVSIESKQTVIALTNLKGDLTAKETINTVKDITLLDDIAKVIKKLQKKYPLEAEKVAGISVGIPGLVDRENGISIKAYGIWEESVDVKSSLESKTGLPVIVENNVYAFAYSEMLFGIGKKYDNLLIIKWGPGVGSAIIIDNKLYEGRHGKAAEIGHVIVDPEGRRCSCGRRGCLQTKISSEALENKSEEEFERALDIFAGAVVNTLTVLAPNRVILYGKMFTEKTFKRFIEKVQGIEPSYGENRIIHSELYEKESFIGPVAAFVTEKMF